jgi:hypothetical protein
MVQKQYVLYVCIEGKGKNDKVHPEQAMKTQRVSRDIGLLFL